MTKQWVIQPNFSHGELDPKLHNTQLDIYYKSCDYLRNMYVRPQGGALRRHGTIYRYTLSNSSVKFGTYTYDINSSYLLVWRDSFLDIYTITDTSFVITYSLASPYTAAQVPDIKFAQIGNKLYTVHPEVTPYILLGGVWTYTAIAYQNKPVYDFSNNYFSANFTLGATTGSSISLTCDTAVFTSNHVGGVYLAVGDNGNPNNAPGLARITAVADSTHATVNIINDFSATAQTGNQSYLAEVAFSADRGYPSAVGTFQSRLCLAGGPSTPNIITSSKVNVPLNFNIFDGADPDAGLLYVLPGMNHNRIEYIESNKSVEVFGTSDTFSTASTLLDGTNTSFNKQTNKGISLKCPPQVLDNDTFYVGEGGKCIFRHIFQPQSGTYDSINVSNTASHLINDPVAMAVLDGDTQDSADYLFLVNSDGTLAALQSMAAENILGWSLCGTGTDMHDLKTMNPNHGKFKDIISINNRIFVLVERIINGETKSYIEELDFSVTTDCTFVKTYSSLTTVITGLDFLEAERVKVFGDGYLLKDQVVENGQITIDRPSIIVKVGLNFKTLLRPMPVNIIGANTKYMPKKIDRVFVDYFNTLGLLINGTPIRELQWSGGNFGVPISPKNGTAELAITGWDSNNSVDISQDDPLPILITGVGYEVTL